MAVRRALTFATLDDVLPDVERLLAGHITVGRWSLGQICNHLTLAIRLSMDGFPDQAPWVLRQTVGRVARWLVLAHGRIPEGVQVPQTYLPRPGLDITAEAVALREAIARFQSFTGRFAAHLLLGRMSGTQWERFHCVHCAHHLSFALPTLAGATIPQPGRSQEG